MKIGYCIWPWGLKTEEQMFTALKEIKQAGYDYCESFATVVEMYKGKVEEFKKVLKEHEIELVNIYWKQKGNIEEDLETVKPVLEFLAANNCDMLNIEAPKAFDKTIKGIPLPQETYRYVIDSLMKVGELAKSYGVCACLHPHWGTVIETEQEIDMVMKNTNPAFVSMCPDTAHLILGKCDPCKIFQSYMDRIKYIHLKDIDLDKYPIEIGDTVMGSVTLNCYLELGEGVIDFPAVYDIIKASGYDGCLTIELDRTKRTHLESAKITREYLKEKLGL